jgi:hypothetical protein
MRVVVVGMVPRVMALTMILLLSRKLSSVWLIYAGCYIEINVWLRRW